MNREDCIKCCNSLLAGERSAIEAYNIAIDKFADEPQVSELMRIKSEHVDSAMQLETSIIGMGGKPASDSGAWGVFVKGLQHTASLFGEESALKLLQKGEEHGENEYKDALKEDFLEDRCRQQIEQDLLPRVCHHHSTLVRLENQVD